MKRILGILILLAVTSCTSLNENLHKNNSGQTFYHYETIVLPATENSRVSEYDFDICEETATQLINTVNRYLAKNNISIVKDPLYNTVQMDEIYNSTCGFYRSTWNTSTSEQYRSDNFVRQYRSDAWNHAIRKNGCTISFKKLGSMATTVTIKLTDKNGNDILRISARDKHNMLNARVIEICEKKFK